MNVGKLYQFKKLCWMLYPSKEIAALVAAPCYDLGTPAYAAAAADAYSKEYKCNVTYLSPEDILVLLEVDGKYKKVLSCKEELSWTWFREDYNKCFEEVKER